MIDKSAVISTLKDFGKVFETIENERIRDFYQDKISQKGTGCIITGRSNDRNSPTLLSFASKSGIRTADDVSALFWKQGK